VVDERVAVALALVDGGVAVPLVLADRVLPVPGEQRGQPLGDVVRAGPVHLVGVAQQHVERGPGDRAPAQLGLEADVIAAPAVLHRDLLERVEHVVRDVAPEAVAARLACEQVVEVAALGLVLLEPRLRHDVLAVERQLRLQGVGAEAGLVRQPVLPRGLGEQIAGD
jgi:hypothetical protein